MKMFSSKNDEKWLKETYEYLKKLKDDKYGDVKLDYIMLYKIHKKEHKEIKRLTNIINELEKYLRNEYSKFNGAIRIANILDKLKELKEGK